MEYKDKNLSSETRAKMLLSMMSVEEKVGQLCAVWPVYDAKGQPKNKTDEWTQPYNNLSLLDALKFGVGQITRPFGSQVGSNSIKARRFNALQKYLMEETRLGIPALYHEEGIVGLMAQDACIMPSALNLGSTWNAKLVNEIGRYIGETAKTVGCRQILAPVLDVVRDYRWGRIEECFGEDPYLVGTLGVEFVNGIQSHKNVMATLKHFVAHAASEGGRNHAPVNIGTPDLFDIHILPFEMVIKSSQPGAIMPAYHDVNGVPSHGDKRLLVDVLREKLGFKGLVVADYGGVTILRFHHRVTDSQAESAKLAFGSGLDMELPGFECAMHLLSCSDFIEKAPDWLDERVYRILKAKFDLELFESPYIDERSTEVFRKQRRDLALESAEQSIVLMKNNGILPFEGGMRKTVGIFGEFSRMSDAMLSSYSHPIHAKSFGMGVNTEEITNPFEAIKDTFRNASFEFFSDSSKFEPVATKKCIFPSSDMDEYYAGDAENYYAESAVSDPMADDLSTVQAASDLAGEVDVSLVFVGDKSGLYFSGTTGEGSDSEDLLLPGRQEELLNAVIKNSKKTIVVLMGSRPYVMPYAYSKADAIINAFIPGEKGGMAIANVLSGKVNPSGKLPLSIPVSSGAVPFYYNHKYKCRGFPLSPFYRVAFPFGHGLSYTMFEFSDFHISKEKFSMDESVEIKCSVKNSGKRSGAEVVQLYVADLVCSVVRPVKELKGYVRIELAPQQKSDIKMRLPIDLLSFTDCDGSRCVEPGEFDLSIATSSSREDIKSKFRILVSGEKKKLGCHWDMFCDTVIEHSE